MWLTKTFGLKRADAVFFSSIACALMVLIMLLAQLYDYDNFASALLVVLPTMSQQLVELLAAAVVISELLMLPYLLNVALSPAMRHLSKLVGGVVCLFWLFVVLTSAHSANTVLFSTVISAPGGLLSLLWSALLTGLFIFVILKNHQRATRSAT